ncbi:(2Fe-2S)-binding protein [Halolamina sp.]|jgi:carbon-monoxide dehydrogenase small subunit|uniref:(2Fe-2S)-binding protein n=1 Tax=Halolamina sp. TaxID=1940283 RepID=UPI000223B58F|nr:Carbon-monoxide dehydrogenase (acceptor) [halophilic archaeon DL31]
MRSDTTDQSVDRPTRQVELTVNGERVAAEVEPRLKLSDFLREEAGLRGVRVGCEHGVCGACTVSYDGDLAKSCLLYAVQVDGSEIVTVEGLDEDGELDPVQRAFHEEHALQCGFCTSGFVLAARDLLAENPEPTREKIKGALADNICRCTGYQHIYAAVEAAAEEIDGPVTLPEAPEGTGVGDRSASPFGGED